MVTSARDLDLCVSVGVRVRVKIQKTSYEGLVFYIMKVRSLKVIYINLSA